MSANNTTEAIPSGGFDTQQKLADGGQLSTVFEVPRSMHGVEKGLQDYHDVNGMPGSNHALPAGGS